jgi:hypothetical protein
VGKDNQYKTKGQDKMTRQDRNETKQDKKGHDKDRDKTKQDKKGHDKGARQGMIRQDETRPDNTDKGTRQGKND